MLENKGVILHSLRVLMTVQGILVKNINMFTLKKHTLLGIDKVSNWLNSLSDSPENTVQTRAVTESDLITTSALTESSILYTDGHMDRHTDILRRGTCGVKLLFIQCNPQVNF